MGGRQRLLEVSFMMVRAGLGYKLASWLRPLLGEEAYENRLKALHAGYAELFFSKATRLRGALIKVGQFASTRVDVLPPEYTKKLSLLQDCVPPVDVRLIRKRIFQELGRPPEELFASFEPVPIASASLGQVHEARLRTGERVAVKVQYPGVEEIIRMDLKAIRFALWLLKRHIRALDLRPIFQEFSRFIQEELDYVHEARNAERFAKSFAGHKDIAIPAVHREYSTAKVLTLEFMEGRRISDFLAEESDPELRRKVGEVIGDSFCEQVFVHRFFHGDPHPGNILVQKSGRVVMLDFGLCKELPAPVADILRDYARAVVTYDAVGVARGARELGFISDAEDERDFRLVMDEIFRHFGRMPAREFKQARIVEFVGRMLHEFFRRARSLRIPNDVIVLSRTLGILEGLSAQLDPSVNLIQMAKPHIMRYVSKEALDPERLAEKAKSFFMAVLGLPEQMKDFYAKANSGGLEVRAEIVNLNRAALKAWRGARLVALSVLLAAASVLFAVAAAMGSALGETSAGVAGAVLLILFVRTFFRES